MKSKKMNRKGLVLTVLALILCAVIAVGGSLAFFTDEGEVTNTFTMGNVEIELTEPGWEPDDGIRMMPGNVRIKDPTVTASEGQSYMRIRVELVDGEENLIINPDRIELILSTLYYDTAYGTASPNLAEGQKYSEAQLSALLAQGKIEACFNNSAFAFAGIEAGKPAVRYYNYIRNDGIFDADKTPADTAVLFTNVVIPKDWNNREIFDLSGDTYVTTENDGLEVTAKGTGYKIIIKAEAIQSAEMMDAAEAFGALNEASGVTIVAD